MLFGKEGQSMKLKKREKITDSLIGTGEQMCTCAAIVADIIIERGQKNASLRDMLGKVQEEWSPCKKDHIPE
jgi:hypothetical protein